jgi:hypothetical protein
MENKWSGSWYGFSFSQNASSENQVLPPLVANVASWRAADLPYTSEDSIAEKGTAQTRHLVPMHIPRRAHPRPTLA